MPRKHLLNCRACDWYEVVDGSLAIADVIREQHGDSIRNRNDDRCPMDAIAWAQLPESAEVVA